MPTFTIKSPEFSFVNFNGMAMAACCEGADDICLPVFKDDDIIFQVNLSTPTISDSNVIMETALENFQLILIDLQGTEVRNWTVDDSLQFERYRTGVKQVTLLWRHGMHHVTPLASDHPPYESWMECDECFRLKIKVNVTFGDTPVESTGTSNCFKVICEDCFTARLDYYNDEDYAGFSYCNVENSVNRVRIPFDIQGAQYIGERSTYRRSNGKIFLTKSVITKQYPAETEHFPEHVHERIIAMLGHTTVLIETDKYEGELSQNGDYKIEWVQGLCLAPASFKFDLSPFVIRNNNCQDCGEGIGGDCPEIEGREGSSVDNGDDTQNYTFTWDPFPPEVSELIIQYRLTGGPPTWNNNVGTPVSPRSITLPLGVHDFQFLVKGECIGRISGAMTLGATTEGCGVPTSIVIDVNEEGDSADVSWTAPIDTVGQYELYYTGGALISDGLIDGDSFLLTGLAPGNSYTLKLRILCDVGVTSAWTEEVFTT